MRLSSGTIQLNHIYHLTFFGLQMVCLAQAPCHPKPQRGVTPPWIINSIKPCKLQAFIFAQKENGRAPNKHESPHAYLSTRPLTARLRYAPKLIIFTAAYKKSMHFYSVVVSLALWIIAQRLLDLSSQFPRIVYFWKLIFAENVHIVQTPLHSENQSVKANQHPERERDGLLLHEKFVRN